MCKIITTISFCLLILKANSQKSEPEFINYVYHMSDTNKFDLLEKTEMSMKTKSKLAGFGGTTSSYVIQGSSSAVYINNQQPSFAVKMSQMMDPSQIIQLFQFEKKENSRESVISKIGVMAKNNTMNTTGIQYNIRKGTNGTYIITPEKPLNPGEYGFMNMMMTSGSSGRGGMPNYTVFAFTIR